MDPSDWQETRQAGCKFYVNHKTGEVATEKPWDNLKANELELYRPRTQELGRKGGSNSSMKRLNTAPSPSKSKNMNNSHVNRTTSTMRSHNNHGNAHDQSGSNLLNISNISRNEDSFIGNTDTYTGTAVDMELDLDENNENEEDIEDRNPDESDISEGDSIIGAGTGAHLYDGSEITSFFSMLDDDKNKSMSRSMRK